MLVVADILIARGATDVQILSLVFSRDIDSLYILSR